MRVAARWIGWQSFALAATGALFVIAATPREEPHHSTVDVLPLHDSTWRAFATDHEEDEIAVQDCFDHNSGLTAIQRDYDDRAKLIFVEEHGLLAACLEGVRSTKPRPVRSPAGVYLHQSVVDPWAPRREAELFPPVKWHRCTGVTPSHVVDADDERMASVHADAEACIENQDFVGGVDLELFADGRVHRVSLDSVAPQLPLQSPAIEARTACIVHAMCQYRFQRPYGQLHFAVITPEPL